METMADDIERALLRFSMIEREHWLAEIRRLTAIIAEYEELPKKRRLNKATGKYEFLPEVLRLCERAACTDYVIVSREPHRARPPAPDTLDRWQRELKQKGVAALLRSPLPPIDYQKDNRRAFISPTAVQWINNNYRRFRGSKALYKDLVKQAAAHDWVIPSESWLRRHWEKIPEIVKVYFLKGESAYISKHAPYVPRNFEDLDALQVLSGDHLERDIFVSVRNKRIARPWVTLWLDLRCYLIWGWCADLQPTSESVSLAYADGLRRYGAQPFARPAENYYSFLQSDWGKTYCSHDIDGKTIEVHRQAFSPTEGFQTLLIEKKVGLVHDYNLVHLKAQPGNAREKPVERIGKDLSDWEANTFPEYCGKNSSERPDKWYELYNQHQKYVRGEIAHSPFISFEKYCHKLGEFIDDFNKSVHERVTLDGEKIVPLDEFNRLYKTRYQIPESEIALLLLKAARRTIRKNGVNCFRRNWNYLNPAMSEVKGKRVEIRYTDKDYQHVYVILPSNEICKAELITPTSIINPNKDTLKKVNQLAAQEKQTIRNYKLIDESRLRGESVEDRFSAQQSVNLEEEGHSPQPMDSPNTLRNSPKILKFPTYKNHRTLALIKPEQTAISAEEVKECEEADIRTLARVAKRIREFG